MERYENDFPSKLKGIGFETLENSEHSIYGLSKDLVITYFNPGWIRFAKENGADESIFSKLILGTPISKAIAGETIEEFYIKNYKRILETGEVWHHEYECSSANEFRLYHQSVFPLKDGEGLIVINTLKVKLPMDQIDRKSYQAFMKPYLQPSGFINQCSNCRHCQRVDQENTWDWIPEWVERTPANMSHTVCPTCYDYYWKFGEIPYPTPITT